MNDQTNATGENIAWSSLYKKYPTILSVEMPVRTKSWSVLSEIASLNIDKALKSSSTNIGSFYIDVAWRMIWLESCARENYNTSAQGRKDEVYLSNSIFVGKRSRQLNMSHWYNPSSNEEVEATVELISHGANTNAAKNLSTRHGPLFEVVDLQSAIRAVIEIIYQGEGGSDCSPFVTSFFGQTSGKELSHYYRFQEIVHGRKLIKVNSNTISSNMVCLNITSSLNCRQKSSLSFDYCYVGQEIPFSADGIWPIISNPSEYMYNKNTSAHRLSSTFNKEYTRLLKCLQRSFGGFPNTLRSCMRVMYNIVMAGKKLVKTPIGALENVHEIKFGRIMHNASPTWKVLRENWDRAGFPIRQ